MAARRHGCSSSELVAQSFASATLVRFALRRKPTTLNVGVLRQGGVSNHELVHQVLDQSQKPQ